ncbi:hypothetical protein BKA81DRAFT_29418 [Phyllosticta paracitricarpa]
MTTKTYSDVRIAPFMRPGCCRRWEVIEGERPGTVNFSRPPCTTSIPGGCLKAYRMCLVALPYLLISAPLHSQTTQRRVSGCRLWNFRHSCPSLRSLLSSSALSYPQSSLFHDRQSHQPSFHRGPTIINNPRSHRPDASTAGLPRAGGRWTLFLSSQTLPDMI